MERSFGQEQGNKSASGVLIVLGILILAGASFYFLSSSSRKMVSPIPPQPSFEIIFYTPTPIPTEEPATPSATPKGKKAPTATVKPTVTKASESPTSVSPTKAQISTTPTVKPSSTTTPKVTP